MPRGAHLSLARIDAVCLDLDGTLVDTLSGWHAAFGELLPELIALAPGIARLGPGDAVYDHYLRGYMHEAHLAAGYAEWSDDFVRVAFRRLVAEQGDARDAAATALADRYIAGSNRHMQLFPEVDAALGWLSGRVPLGLISNGLGRDQRAKIAQTRIGERFRAIVISEEVGLLKPDPAIFRYALERLGAAPQRALYVGDHPEQDVAGARGAGLLTVWMRRDDAYEGAAPEADACVGGLDELTAVLLAG